MAWIAMPNENGTKSLVCNKNKYSDAEYARLLAEKVDKRKDKNRNA